VTETLIVALLIAIVCLWAATSEWLRDGLSRVFDARRDHDGFTTKGETP
jgi:hypothetical protein